MKNLTLILVASLTLSGCASTCHTACLFGVFGPGNPAFDAIALAHDRADACQTGAHNEQRRIELGRSQGYTAPDFCKLRGSNTQSSSQIYDAQGRRVGVIRGSDIYDTQGRRINSIR